MEKGYDLRWSALALLLVLIALGTACAGGEAPTLTLAATVGIQVTLPPEGIATPGQSPPPETPTSLPQEPTALATAPPTATPTAEAATWYGEGALALFVVGDYDRADLYVLGGDGSTRRVYEGVGQQVRVSSNGRWLGFVRWGQDGRATLALHDARGDGSRQIIPDTSSGIFPLVFDPAGRRLAYLDLGAPGEAGVPWALVVVDLDSGAVARHDALMRQDDRRLLPGAPVAWSRTATAGDELILDTFLPYTEGGWMGVWGVTLPADGVSAPLESLALRELLPGAPAYVSDLYFAPDGQSLAFLGRDSDYYPENYSPEFYDLAVNRLDILALADGARITLVEADDGSALGRALAWSPAGERLLFVQGRYEGPSFLPLTLKSSDRGGAVVEHGSLTLPPRGDLLDLAWCDASSALYVAWDGGEGTQRLFLFDLEAGLSTEITAGQRVEIVGCAP